MNAGVSLGGRRLRGFAIGDSNAPPPMQTSTDAHSPTSTEVRSPTSTRTATEVRSPTSTSTEVRSPTSTSTEVRSPTNTSTEAYTADNFTATVTGGAGAGATTTVNIYPTYSNRQPRSADGTPAAFPEHKVQPPRAMKEMLREVMSTPPPTGVMREMVHEVMSTPPPTNAGRDMMRETMREPMNNERVSLGGCGVGGVFRYEGLRLPGLDGPGVAGPSGLIIAASKRPLDANLPQATENAVLIAVKQETDPAKLQAFAQSLLPDYPSAASVLMARAAKLIVDTAAAASSGTVGKETGVGFNFFHVVGDVAKVTPIGAAVNFAENKVRDANRHHAHHGRTHHVPPPPPPGVGGRDWVHDGDVVAQARQIIGQVERGDRRQLNEQIAKGNRGDERSRALGRVINTIYAENAAAYAASGGRGRPAPPSGVSGPASGGLASGQSLPVGQSVFSPGGGMELRLQPDGNLVLYHGTTPLWNTWTNGAKGQSLVMQADGNLVYQGTDSKPLWNAGTNGHPGASLAVQDDGNLVVYTPDHHAIWSSQTNGFASRMHIAGQGFLAHVVKDAVKIGPLAFVPGAGAAVVLASGIAALGHTAAGKKIGTDLAKNKVLSTIAKTYTTTYQQANPLFFAKGLVLGAADEMLHGKNIGQALADQTKKGVAFVADGVKRSASAAGVPPTVLPAINAAANIAEGGNIPSNIVNAAGTVVGQAVGPAATAALQQGSAYADQLAKGVTGPVLAQIADARAALPPEVTHAFDSGIALQLGQHLQGKGYAAAHALLPPGDGSIASKVITALNGPKDLLSAAVKDVQRSLPQGAADLAHRATAAIVSQPALAKLSSPQLAQHLNVPETIARTALASVSHEVPGAPIVHPHRLEHIVGRPSAPDPSRRGRHHDAWVAHYTPQAPAPSAAAAYEPYPTAVAS